MRARRDDGPLLFFSAAARTLYSGVVRAPRQSSFFAGGGCRPGRGVFRCFYPYLENGCAAEDRLVQVPCPGLGVFGRFCPYLDVTVRQPGGKRDTSRTIDRSAARGKVLHQELSKGRRRLLKSELLSICIQ